MTKRNKTAILLAFFKNFKLHRTFSLFHDGGRLRSKSMDWFLYDNGLRHERVKDRVQGCRDTARRPCIFNTTSLGVPGSHLIDLRKGRKAESTMEPSSALGLGVPGFLVQGLND